MDRDDFELFYGQEAEGVFRFALSLCGREDIAKDVVQEVFLKVARDATVLDKIEEKKAFLFRMVRNAIIDRGRRDSSWRARGERWGEEMGLEASTVDPDEHEFVRWLEGALAALPEEQRSVVVMHLWEGMTFAEIGEVCGVSGNTAASRCRYALDKMRGQLRPLYEEIRS